MILSLLAFVVLGMSSQGASSSPACGLRLSVSGGTFSPDECHLEIVVGRTTDYSLVLRRTGPQSDQIESITLFNIKAFKKAKFVFDAQTGASDFKGQLIDKGAIARNLVRGVLELDPRANDQVRVTCDLRFSNGIRIQGSGQIPVRRVYAPASR